jgi:hypothetical protein
MQSRKYCMHELCGGSWVDMGAVIRPPTRVQNIRGGDGEGGHTTFIREAEADRLTEAVIEKPGKT